MVNTEGEDILGPTFPDNTHILDNYVCAGVKQIFNGIVTPNDSNANKNNIPVTYKIYDSNNTLLNTINTTTNSNGGHELQYTFPHKGNYNIIASVGDDTVLLPVSVESLVDQITLSSSSNSVIKGNNVTLIAEVRSSTGDIVVGADVIFKITENIDSFTEEKSISDYFELDYDIHYTLTLNVIGNGTLPEEGDIDFEYSAWKDDTETAKWKVQSINYQGTYNDKKKYTINCERWANWPPQGSTTP